MPELTEKSDLLSDDQRKLLYRYLPPRVQVNSTKKRDYKYLVPEI